MNYRVFLNTWQAWRVRVFIMGLALFGFELLIVAIYPSFGKFFVDLPQALKVFLRIGAGIDFGAGQFLALGYFHPLWLIVSSAFAISLAASSVAGEIDRGTIGVLLARPVPRYQLITSRALLLVLGAAALMLASVAGTALGIAIVDINERIDLPRFLLVAINGLALLAAVGGYTFLFSALFDSGGKAISFSVGLTLILYLIHYLAGLWTTVESLGPLSLFHYYQPGDVVRNGLPWKNLLVLPGVAFISVAISLIIVERRDIPA